MKESYARFAEIERLAGLSNQKPDDKPAGGASGGHVFAKHEKVTGVKSRAQNLVELASSEPKYNTGGLPLAGRVFTTSNGQTIKVCSQDLRHVKYVNFGKDGQQSSEFTYPLKDFETWITKEITPTDNWPYGEVPAQESKGGLSLSEHDRGMIKQVLSHNGNESTDFMDDAILLKEFATLVAEKVGGNPNMGSLLDFMVKSGVDKAQASIFLSQLGY